MPFLRDLQHHELAILFASGAFSSLMFPLTLDLDALQVALAVATSAGLATASLLMAMQSADETT